ncbi:hypothetical protein [Acidisphaera sp. L21]|uniref:hypothetical protein n=1 Tax=Acidisphaera sp. L21 TaxID=1641851 RepID=UPI00131CFBA4|nr:hypothetical protein [Acidisphaera sp. L21]
MPTQHRAQLVQHAFPQRFVFAPDDHGDPYRLRHASWLGSLPQRERTSGGAVVELKASL